MQGPVDIVREKLAVDCLEGIELYRLQLSLRKLLCVGDALSLKQEGARRELAIEKNGSIRDNFARARFLDKCVFESGTDQEEMCHSSKVKKGFIKAREKEVGMAAGGKLLALPA